jgi:2'-5' RNA ligase
LHATLVFLGDTADDALADLQRTLETAAAGHAPFDVTLGSAGVFGGSSPQVLWAGVDGEVHAMVSLRRALARSVIALGWTPEERPYSPHVTLARARSRRGDPALRRCADALAGEAFGAVRVQEAVLYRSDLTHLGPHYSVVARLPLSRAS